MHARAGSINGAVVAAATLLAIASCGGSAEPSGDTGATLPPADLSIEQVRERLSSLDDLDCSDVVPYEDVPAGLTGNDPAATLECTRADSVVYVAAYDTPEQVRDNVDRVRDLGPDSSECSELRGLGFVRGRSWIAFATDADDETDVVLLSEVGDALGATPESVDC